MPLHKLHPTDFDAKETVQNTTRWAATCAFLYGLSLVQGGDPIWGSRAYRTASAIPWSPESWGVVYMLASVLMFAGMFTGRRGLMVSGLIIGAAWNLFFAASFLTEYIRLTFVERAADGFVIGWGVVVTYAFIAGFHIFRIPAYLGDWRPIAELRGRIRRALSRDAPRQ